MSSAKKNLYIKANGNKCASVNIMKDTESLNTCDVKCVARIDTEDGINVTINGEEVFQGIVKECIKSDDKVHYKIHAEELACQLMNEYFVKDDMPNIVVKALNLNSNAKKTIGDYLSILPEIPIKSALDSNDYGSMTTIPFTEIPLPEVQFGRMTKYTSYKTFLSDIIGLPFWFEMGSTTPTYGLCRAVSALQLPRDFIVDTGMESETYIPPYDSIVVIDDNRDKYGMAGACHGAGVPDGTYQGVYQYDGEHTIEELNAMASSILKLKGTVTQRWKVVFAPGAALQFREGDIIQAIGDQTIKPVMPYQQGSGGTNVTGYQVKTVEISDTGTVLYLGSTKRTIFDVMKDRLRLVDGTGIPTETIIKETDTIKFTPADPYGEFPTL